MIVLFIGLLLIGAGILIMAIVAVWKAQSRDDKDVKLAVMILLLLALGIFFIGASGYCSGLGNPKSIVGERLPLPENEIFVVKAIEEDEKDISLLVVPFADQNRERIYYVVPIEKIAENISVDCKITNDGDSIRKI